MCNHQGRITTLQIYNKKLLDYKILYCVIGPQLSNKKRLN